MKCIFKDSQFQRVDNETAEIRLKQGWNFAPKSDWKKNTRDVQKSQTVIEADVKGKETKNKKAEKSAKLKDKQRTPENTDKLFR
jgi:hypothetical protein